jgi:hypothetical protein
LKLTSEIQKFGTRNPTIQGLDFCVKNALKLTYEHLGYRKILRGLRPCTPGEGRRWKRREKGWVGGDERERKGGEEGKERQGKRKGKGGEGGRGGEGKGREREGMEGKGKE